MIERNTREKTIAFKKSSSTDLLKTNRVDLMSSEQKPIAAFVLSLLSGILVMIVSVIWCLWLGVYWDMGWMGGMMHEWQEHMHMWNLESVAHFLGLFGVIFGLTVIVAAIMLYLKPMQHELWGVLIIVFSAISILSCMGGFGAGLVLGIIGGILAILWKPEKSKTAQKTD